MGNEKSTRREIVSVKEISVRELPEPSRKTERPFGIEQGGPVIVVWRIAYDQHSRPFLAQREILHPSHVLTYARWFPYEKSLPRRGSQGGRRGAAA